MKNTMQLRNGLMAILAGVALMAVLPAGCVWDDGNVAPRVDDEELGEETPLVDLSEFDLDKLRSNEIANHARVDRMGMPAVATVVITSKDDYNQAGPLEDAAGAFVPEIIANVGGLHAALDDDLMALGLTPCATGDCVNQAAPLVVPDVIRIDASQPAGFPNGRRLTDPVVDITLAVILLDLQTHPATALIGVNPTENDVRFRRKFPYLGKAQRLTNERDDDDDDDDDDDEDDDD